MRTTSRTYKESGAYAVAAQTGTMAAGLAAATPICSLRWATATANARAVIDRIAVSIASLGTGFTAGIGYVDAAVARAFTVGDGGGGALTLTGDNAKRAARPMGSTLMSAIRLPTTDLVTPTNATFSSGAGTLTTGTYWYRVSAINANGETLASTQTSQAVTGPAGVNVNWNAVTGATGYKIYGRTTGAQQLLATVGAVTTWLDDGSLTPAGALPTTNTTGIILVGARTLDAQAFAGEQFAVSAATNTVHLPTKDLWRPDPDTYPLVLAANEGVIVRATVPATGTWQGVVTVEWREVLG